MLSRTKFTLATLAATLSVSSLFIGVRSVASVQEKAEGETWWSLRAIAKPALPEPPSQFKNWPHNAIDHFVLAKLLEKKLTPSPEADRVTLLRRVCFDLIGLPPTPEEIVAFAADKSADAYEKVVDRLLASPRHGERWARHWMDVIHFAETHGHDQDVPRDNAWPYRDYLIESLNADKPYARFIEEQIAGDVLFPEDPRGIVALGFLSAGPWDESTLDSIRPDSIDRKQGQYLDRDDMIGTVTYAFLSTTVQCARCHDHKFDPISQEEYYGLQAVFAGVDRKNRPYDNDVSTRARRTRLTQLKQDLSTNPALLAKLLQDPAHTVAVAEWEKARQSTQETWKVLDPARFTSAGGAATTKLPDLSIRYHGKRAEKDTYVIEADVDLAKIAAVRLEVLSDESLPQKGPGRQDNGNLHLSEFKVEAIQAGQRQPLPIARAFADFNQAGWEISKAIDGVLPTAWGIYPAVGQSHVAVFVLKTPVQPKGATRLVFTLEQQHGGGHLIGRPRLSASSEVPTTTKFALPPAIAAILKKKSDERSVAEKTELAVYVLKAKVDEELVSLPAPKLVYAATPEFVGDGSSMPSKGTCKPVHMLRRGDIKRPLAAAVPGALACVCTLEPTFKLARLDDEGQRRAALARWISSPKNPLTWRSIANRVWHYHFGQGIVSTPNDFGRMGARPTHPELLDWLAGYLLENDGSLKKLHRIIVTSAAYRQSSGHNAEYAKMDADNAYLWRMNRTKLDAETLRDSVLQIAGKLDLTMGGPSVKHFLQSPGIHRTPNVDYQKFDPDAPGAHRRSIYRFIFRTVPDPFFDSLDCPDASQFTPVRANSLSALQALTLLNDPFIIRMSEHLAKRVESAGIPEEQIRLAYRLTLGREPTVRERSVLAGFAGRRGMANACRVLLNCNEFLFVN